MFFILKDSDEKNNVFQQVENNLRETTNMMIVNKAKLQFSAVTTKDGIAIIHSMAHPILFEKQLLPYVVIQFKQIIECLESHNDIYFLTPNCSAGLSDEELLQASFVYSDRVNSELRYYHNNEIVRSTEYSMCAILFSAYKVPNKDVGIIVFNNKCVEIRIGGKKSDYPVKLITMNETLNDYIRPLFNNAIQVGDFLFSNTDHIEILFNEEISIYFGSIEHLIEFDGIPGEFLNNKLILDLTNVSMGTPHPITIKVKLGKFFEAWNYASQNTVFEYVVYRT